MIEKVEEMKEAEFLTENEKSELALFLIQSLDKKENKNHDELWRQEIIHRDEDQKSLDLSYQIIMLILHIVFQIQSLSGVIFSIYPKTH